MSVAEDLRAGWRLPTDNLPFNDAAILDDLLQLFPGADRYQLRQRIAQTLTGEKPPEWVGGRKADAWTELRDLGAAIYDLHDVAIASVWIGEELVGRSSTTTIGCGGRRAGGAGDGGDLRAGQLRRPVRTNGGPARYLWQPPPVRPQ